MTREDALNCLDNDSYHGLDVKFVIGYDDAKKLINGIYDDVEGKMSSLKINMESDLLKTVNMINEMFPNKV